MWEWELSAIHAKLISNNVVELLVGQIRELPVTVIETLKSAACIGNTFKLNTLSTVRKQDIGVIADLLDEAINEGYVFYKNVNQIHWVREGMDVEFQFSHDRVQQALYSLIPDEEKQQTHYEIGKLLYASLQPAQAEEQIFQLVFHLNFGIDIITDAASKLWLAQLNLKAGKEAKKIIAYESAYVYLSIASKLCGEQIWRTEPDFALKLGSELLDSTYLSNRFEEAEKYFIDLIEHINDPVKKAEMYYRKMIQYQHLSKIDNILDTGLEGLALLGMEFSPRTGRMKVLSELVKTSLMLRGKTDEDLLNMPEVSDPKIRIAMSLIYKTMVFAYDRSENLMAILGMNLLQLSVQYGNYKDSLAGYSTYAGILSIAFNNYKQAGRLNSVALKVADKVADKPAHAMAYFGAGMTTYTPFRQSYSYFKKSFDTAVEGGAHTDAAPSTMYFYFLSFIQGKRLSEVHQILLDNLYFTDQIKTENFHLILLAGVNCVHELKEGLETPATGLRGKKLDAQELEEKIQNTEHRSIRIYARIFQMYNHMTFGHYDKALKCEKEVMDGLNVTLGTVIGPYFHYLRGILYSRLLQQQGMVTRKEARSVIAGSLKRIHKFNLTCTDNFQVWEWMLKAELARIDQKKEEAQEAYNNAIEIARTASNLTDVALGSFQCALFHEQNGNKKIAEFYYQESVSGYKAWGADAVAHTITATRKGVTGTSQMVGAVPLMDIDQESLIRLSQLISSEIDYHRLIKKLMTVFVENAGAEKAFLIMNTNGEWYIEAEQRKNEEVIMERHLLFDPAAPEGSNHAVPISVCQYVIRTGETVIIENATSDERFSKSTYIKTNHPKSIICMPLIKKGELTGLVYLENNLMSGAFKTDRIQLLNYISSQIAVSVDNAKLYSDVKNLNQSYERFVPKEFLEMLGKKSIMDVKLGDQVQMNMTVLFADIRDFTGRSEKMSPAENFQFINEYLSRMEPIIRKYNGFIDKYVGDEIMALFPTHADDAIQCGIAMIYELRVYGEVLKQHKTEPIEIGIGLNTGVLMLGTVGGQDRMNSTVISDAVNLASRVEKDTKASGAPFMITKETYDALRDPSNYAVRKLGRKMYRGKSTYTEVYEVFEGDEPSVINLKKETKIDFEKGIALYDNQEMEAALTLFSGILKKNPADKAAALYVNSIMQFLNSRAPATETQKTTTI